MINNTFFVCPDCGGSGKRSEGEIIAGNTLIVEIVEGECFDFCTPPIIHCPTCKGTGKVNNNP